MTQTLSAHDHRAFAATAEGQALASFDRCDTDGFLSQWASRLSAQKHRAQAALIDDGGTIETLAVFTLDGQIASAHQGFGQYGEYWVLNDAAAEVYGKRFFSPSKARPGVAYRNDRAKGFVFGFIRVAAYVKVAGSGTGLGGLYSAQVVTLPVVEDLKSGNYVVVSTDVDRDQE